MIKYLLFLLLIQFKALPGGFLEEHLNIYGRDEGSCDQVIRQQNKHISTLKDQISDLKCELAESKGGGTIDKNATIALKIATTGVLIALFWHFWAQYWFR